MAEYALPASTGVGVGAAVGVASEVAIELVSEEAAASPIHVIRLVKGKTEGQVRGTRDFEKMQCMYLCIERKIQKSLWNKILFSIANFVFYSRIAIL